MLTTLELLKELKNRSLISTNQSTFSDDFMIGLLNSAASNHLVPLIQKYRQEYLIAEARYPLTVGMAKIAIPTNALAGKIRSISLEMPGRSAIQLNGIERNDRELYLTQVGHNPCWYIEGNNIRFAPLPTVAGTLVVGYLQRPSKLVTDSQGRRVTAVNKTTGSIQINAEASWIKQTEKLDVLNGDYPSEVRVSTRATQIIQPTKTIIFPDASDIEVGDYVVLSGTTTVAQIPEELNNLWLQYALRDLYQSMGDQQGVNNAMATIQKMEADIRLVMDDRKQSEPIILVNRNSPLRR